jgi:hypothetical protein
MALACLAGLGIWFGLAATGGGRPPSPAAAASKHGGQRKASGRGARSRSPHLAARIFDGPDGVESSAVVAENGHRGSTAWRLGPQPKPGYIAGFAGTTDAIPGQRVRLYVSTSAPSFRVIAYRMGFYGGDDARLVFESGIVAGRVQPACALTPQVNMVSCDAWRPSLSVRIGPAFVPGDYLLELVAAGGAESYVLLTVSDPASRAAYLVVARSMTEEAWNDYGGYDLYGGEGPCTFDAPSYPPCNRSRIVSFDRPYADGNGAADFLTEELPLVEYLEEHGLDVTYTTDVAVSADPALLLGHRAIISLAHDETWTWPELRGVQQALAKGENVAFLSAAAIVRHARLQASPLGPDREVVDYRDPDEDPLYPKSNPMLVTGNTWDSPPTDWSTTSLVGQLYSGFLYPGDAVPFVVAEASSWAFAGTGLRNGSTIPQLIASDVDHLDTAYPTPSDIEVLGHSPVPLADAYTSLTTWDGDTYSDMTYWTDKSSGAGVLDTGTVNWVTALTECPLSQASCPSRLVQRITANVLRLFGSGPAGRRQPSVPNWQGIAPAGS